MKTKTAKILPFSLGGATQAPAAEPAIAPPDLPELAEEERATAAFALFSEAVENLLTLGRVRFLRGLLEDGLTNYDVTPDMDDVLDWIEQRHDTLEEWRTALILDEGPNSLRAMQPLAEELIDQGLMVWDDQQAVFRITVGGAMAVGLALEAVGVRKPAPAAE
jgi:hypothetical protein